VKINLEISEHFYTAKYLSENGCVFQYDEDSIFNGRTITLGKKELIFLASCSYMGLEKHPELIKASIDAVKKFGTQTPCSRAAVSSILYKELEDLLKDMFPGYHIVAQTVTLAHCAVLPLLINDKDAIILDAFAHNSIRMASQLCKANGTFVIVSKHNDMDHIRYLVKRLKKDGYRNIWYCADGIYSIHGNVCDIKGLHKLLDEEDNFYAYIDDAHGTGWCGKNGSGYVIGAFGLHEKMIVVESFAKSMVTSGGAIIVPDRIVGEYIKYSGQTMIFSGPVQPPTLAALVACVKLHLSDEIVKLQNELLELIHYFRDRCDELDISLVSKDITPIQFLRIGSVEGTFKVLKRLFERGFYAVSIVYPAINKGDEGIRIMINRHIKKSDIDSLLDNLTDILKIEKIDTHLVSKLERMKID
jgi:7-keto-8-aminopelargonate synthetase-like enzyme